MLSGPQSCSGRVRKISPHRDSIPGPSIFTWQSVTVPIINWGTRVKCGENHAPAAVLSDIWRRFGRKCFLFHQRRPYTPPLTLHPITEDTNIPGVTQSLFVIILVNKWTWMHNISCMFISILYMFRAAMCPLSGELLYQCDTWFMSLCRWPSVMQVLTCIPDGHLHRVT